MAEIKSVKPRVGDLLKASWGYDQTNIDWLEVVAVSASGERVRLRELEDEIVSGPGISDMAGYSSPVRGRYKHDGCWARELAGWKKVQVNRACEPGAYYVKLKSYAYAHLSDGNPAYCSWYA